MIDRPRSTRSAAFVVCHSIAVLISGTYEGVVFRFPPLTPLVKRLLISMGIAYVGMVVAANWMGFAPLIEQLALTPELGIATLWQPLTYPWVQPTGPNGMLMFMMDLVFFWWVVAPFETTFGIRHTGVLLVATTLASATVVVVVGMLMTVVSDPVNPFIGAGPLFGVTPHILAAIAALAWSMRHKGDLNFFGVLPMKAKTLIYLVLGLSALHFLTSKDITNLVADLAAVGTGIAFIEHLSRPPKAVRKAKKRSAKDSGLRVVQGGKSDDPPKWLN